MPFLASSMLGMVICPPNMQRAEPLSPSNPGKKKPRTVTW